jgi:hypothetical protein
MMGIDGAWRRHWPLLEALPVVKREGIMSAEAHRQSVEASLATIASVLQEVLSRRVTAYTVGVKDAKTVGRWASGEITEIRNPVVERRLRDTYAIVELLLNVDAPQTIKAWFVGMNPELDDQAPSEVIREGKASEVMGAARVFVVNG